MPSLVCALLCAASIARADEPVDLAMITRIRDEAFNRSGVMETVSYLCDVIGPRLTNSPSMRRANDWTRERLAAWGLANAHLESWGPFGAGWSLEHVSVHMLAPSVAPLLAVPKAWSPGTEGALRASVMKAKVESEADLAAYKGKLAGKIALLADAVEIKGEDKAPLTRYSTGDLEALGLYEIPPARDVEKERQERLKRHRLEAALRRFLAEENAVAGIEPSDWAGVVRVGGTRAYETGEPRGVPRLVMLPEHYNRLLRLLDRGLDVQLELDVRATFHEDDRMGYNTVADLPGTDKKEEIVMAGAHLDSWHAGTGATDNGAGVAVVLEAVRILKALDVKPRRTIRVALWSGEEQTEGGSEGYVSRHFAQRAAPANPEEASLPVDLQSRPGALSVKPEHARLSAYFNVDNGTGRIRGVYLQENEAAAPIFEAWMKPLADLGVTTLTMRNTEETDHEIFDTVGLPAFQFVQDDVEYSTRTWHSSLDLYDRLKREDLMQASAVVATFLYEAATREALLPRKPMPKE